MDLCLQGWLGSKYLSRVLALVLLSFARYHRQNHVTSTIIWAPQLSRRRLQTIWSEDSCVSADQWVTRASLFGLRSLCCYWAGLSSYMWNLITGTWEGVLSPSRPTKHKNWAQSVCALFSNPREFQILYNKWIKFNKNYPIYLQGRTAPKICFINTKAA